MSFPKHTDAVIQVRIANREGDTIEQSYRVFVAAVRKRSRRGGWSRLVPDACDVCGADATWSHPEGGLRCDYCPKPESKAATPRRGSDE